VSSQAASEQFDSTDPRHVSAPTDAAAPTVSVIICAYTLERWQNLLDAVESVAHQSRAASETIVVIDGNPELEQRAQQAFPYAKVLANAYTPGLSGGRRTGAEAARSDVLAFLDDDAIADPDWLEQLAAPYEDPAVLGVGGLIDPLWEQPAPHWFPPEFNWVVGCTYAGMPVRRGRIRNPIGANMSVRADVLARSGTFDDRLGRAPGGHVLSGTAEETEFCIRASRLHPGHYWIYEPQARVRHAVTPQRATRSYFARRCVVEGSAKALLAHFTGTGDGLQSERSYATAVLPRAVLRDLGLGLRGRREGFARAAAIVIGLAITTLAYARTRVAIARSGSPGAPESESDGADQVADTPHRWSSDGESDAAPALPTTGSNGSTP
jgi:glycosyltransferase involved in cell wall biosynthesis